MASPTVEATATSSVTSAGTSHTVSLPTGIVSGSGLRVTFAWTAGIPQTITWPAGWTPITGYKHERSAANQVGIDSAYRQADGTEGASITVTTSASTKSAHIAKRYAGHESFATRTPEAGTGIDGGTSNPDPPAITPTGGSKDYLFEADAVCDEEDFTWTAPTNYTNQLVANTGVVGTPVTNCSVASARRALTASSEDPGTFTHVLTGWVAQTVAIHPPAAAVSLTGVSTIVLNSTGEADQIQKLQGVSTVVLNSTGQARQIHTLDLVSTVVLNSTGTLTVAAFANLTGVSTIVLNSVGQARQIHTLDGISTVVLNSLIEADQIHQLTASPTIALNSLSDLDLIYRLLATSTIVVNSALDLELITRLLSTGTVVLNTAGVLTVTGAAAVVTTRGYVALSEVLVGAMSTSQTLVGKVTPSETLVGASSITES